MVVEPKGAECEEIAEEEPAEDETTEAKEGEVVYFPGLPCSPSLLLCVAGDAVGMLREGTMRVGVESGPDIKRCN